MIYGYIRVSTDKQDYENQKLGIESKANAPIKAYGLDKPIYAKLCDKSISGIQN